MGMTKDQLDSSLSRIMKRLLTNEYFFGCLTMQVTHEWVPADDKIKEGAMCWDGEDFILKLNEKAWAEYTDFERYCIIKHEILHLAMYHMVQYQTEMNQDRKVANWAADICVDQYIKDIDMCTAHPFMTIDSLAKYLNVSPSQFPLDKGLREYFNIIKQIQKQNQNQNQNNPNQCGGGSCSGSGSGSGNGQDDGDGQDGPSGQTNHNYWNQGNGNGNGGGGQQGQGMSSVVQNLMQQSINRKLLQAEQAAMTGSDGRGTIPGFIQEILNAIKKPDPPVFNWGAYVRQFVQTVLKSRKRLSKHKLNMRYEDGFEDLIAGKKKKRESRIMVGIDSSGSVSSKLLEKFADQLVHISKNCDIDVVVCDTQINDRFKFKKGADLKITGRGGTEFQPVIDEYLENKKNYSCLIYFTDGECPAPEVKFAKNSILWVTYGGYINHDLENVGRMIHIEEKDY